MGSDFDCIEIPSNLVQFKKTDNVLTCLRTSQKSNFGVKVVKNSVGEIERTDYYTDSGELIKSIYYQGSSISVIKNYRNGRLYAEERLSEGKLISKGIFDQFGNVVSGIAYKYNRDNRIVSIEKSLDGDCYLIEYDYDELDRVNYRRISLNKKNVNEQKYKFDILDRIVEYEDHNQKIKVLKISKKNELIQYQITDRIGNEIAVTNYFDFDRYVYTDILLNGHSTTIKDKSYVDNIMLKKPYTTEDDLDLIIANLFAETDPKTARTNRDSTSETCINEAIRARVLPISIRKRVLYSSVVNL